MDRKKGHFVAASCYEQAEERRGAFGDAGVKGHSSLQELCTYRGGERMQNIWPPHVFGVAFTSRPECKLNHRMNPTCLCSTTRTRLFVVYP